MATLNYNAAKQRSGNYTILAIIRDPSIKDRLKIPTGFSIESADHWNSEKQRAKDCKEASRINQRLTRWESMFNEYVDERNRFNLPFKGTDIVDMYTENAPSTRNPAKYLTDLYLAFMDSLTLTHDPKTIKKYEVVYHQLLDFEMQEMENGNKVVLPNVNWDFFNDFAGWLIRKQDNTNKTILRKLKNIRTVMNYATEIKKYIKTYDWKAKLDLKDVDPYKVPLSVEEMQTIQNYLTTDLTRRMIVDAFITGLYTGLRYSDLQQLSDQHFHKHKDMTFINLSSEKMLSKDSIPVPDFLLEILKKYRNKGRLFRLGENALSNKILKQCAREMKLTRRVEKISVQGSEVKREVVLMEDAISFHFARYTYIYLLDTGGLQATYIQLNAGHKDFKTTQGYLKSDTIRRMYETVDALKKVIDM